jgi:hypothetical protein
MLRQLIDSENLPHAAALLEKRAFTWFFTWQRTPRMQEIPLQLSRWRLYE